MIDQDSLLHREVAIDERLFLLRVLTHLPLQLQPKNQRTYYLVFGYQSIII